MSSLERNREVCEELRKAVVSLGEILEELPSCIDQSACSRLDDAVWELSIVHSRAVSRLEKQERKRFEENGPQCVSLTFRRGLPSYLGWDVSSDNDRQLMKGPIS